MDRRVDLEDKTAELEHQCFNLDPERWGFLYRDHVLPGVKRQEVNPETGEQEVTITDPTDLDAWFEGLHQTRTISPADAARFNATPFGLAVGEGRRV